MALLAYVDPLRIDLDDAAHPEVFEFKRTRLSLRRLAL